MRYAVGGEDTAGGEKPPGALLWIAGFWLPAAVVLVELTTRMCAETFFDPLPTALHTACVAAVPILNALVLWRLPREQSLASLPWLNGIAFGVSALYALTFLPIVPIGVFALLLVGLGLLPLTPLIAFIAAWRIRVRVRRLVPNSRRAFLVGALAPMALLVVVDAHRVATRVAMSKATSDDEVERLGAVRWLRRFGNEAELLNQSYGSTGPRINPLAFAIALAYEPPSTAKAREVYYRATGRAFNASGPPSARGRRFDFWDEDQGGEQVGAVQRRLFLAQSTLDGSLDPDGAVGYIEWVMEFANEDTTQQEARAQIQLPRGGVVSRATLWVNGMEQEAVIAARGAARRAYENVVRQQRDPLLVTTAGAERVLVQCFPVPPGGRMKIRIGVTFPMELPDRTTATAGLPYFVERNFAVRSDLRHAVWIESEGRLRSTGSGLAEEVRDGVFTLRGLLSEEALRRAGFVHGREIALSRNALDRAWAEDIGEPRDATAHASPVARRMIVQSIEERPAFRPGRIVIVLDTSAAMRDSGAKLASALSSLPAGREIFVIPATDEQLVSPLRLSTGGEGPRRLIDQLNRLSFAGGVDNSRALVAAWDLAAGDANGLVLWIHGPQPIALDLDQALNQRFDRRADGPRLWLYPVAPGPNRVLEGLSPRASTRWIAASEDLVVGLHSLFGSMGAGAMEYIPVRERVDASAARRSNRWLRA